MGTLRVVAVGMAVVFWIAVLFGCGGAGNKTGGNAEIIPAERGRGGEQKKEGGAVGSEKAESRMLRISEGVKVKDAEFRITKVSIEKVPLVNLGTESKSVELQLVFRLEIKNTSETKKLEYRSWSGADFNLGERDYATATDNFDNNLRRVSFGIGSHPVGAVNRSESIYPGKSITDVLVFELPVDAAKSVVLELPEKNLSQGVAGRIQFQVQAEEIQGFAPKKK